MSLCHRLIGGIFDRLDTIASFWQTPREVEWAKAAADGLAEREDGLGPILDNFIDEPVFTPAVESAFRSGGQTFQTGPRPKLSTSHAALCACGHWLHPGNACAACGCTNVRLPKTSAPTPGAVDGPAEGEPPEPSAGVGPNSPKWIRDLIEATENYVGAPPGSLSSPLESVEHAAAVADIEAAGGVFCYAEDDLARSAAVESPASVPAAESPAPEFDWVTTAIPVIAGVLAEHGGRVSIHDAVVRCFRAGENRAHAEFADWLDWSNHVAPHIAIAIQSDFLSTIYEDTTFAINAFSGDRPRPLADFPKHQK